MDATFRLAKQAKIYINNFNCFLNQNILLKYNVMKSFSDIILPFWQDDIRNIVFGGKPKPFNIYLVDNNTLSVNNEDKYTEFDVESLKTNNFDKDLEINI